MEKRVASVGDAFSTKIWGKLVEVVAWQDNEWVTLVEWRG